MVGTWTSKTGAGSFDITKSGTSYVLHQEGDLDETGQCVNGVLNLPYNERVTLADNGDAVSWLSHTYQKGN